MSPDEKTLAYFAGFFDGEGSIVISMNRKSRSYWLQVRVTNTNREILDLFQTTFGGGIGTQGVEGPNYGAYRNRTCWFWVATTLGAEKFLRYILPYAVVKRAQIELALEFQMLSRSKENGLYGKVTDKELQDRQSFKDRISKLNQRHKRVISL